MQRKEYPPAKILSQSPTQMEEEIEILAKDHAVADAQYKLLVTTLDEKWDPNDEVRDWLTEKQSLAIRKQVVQNAYDRLTEGDHIYMTRKDRDDTRSKWCTDNEEVLWDDNYFYDQFGEYAYNELLVELERQRILNKREKLDFMQARAMEKFGSHVILSQLNTQQ